MSWYMAVIVRGSFTEAGLDREHMGDLLYKLVEAPDAETAFAKAVALGEGAVDTYNDEEGAEMSLRYLGLADLMELTASSPGDGIEVYSQAVNAKPWERVRAKEALTVFQPWEIPEGGEEDLGEVTEVDEIADVGEKIGEIPEPGAERFRPPARED